MAMTVIQTEGVSKRYGPFVAVQGLDLQVRAGRIFGFLGANGAGKTTTIRMLLGLIRPTTGRVRLFGGDLGSQGIALRRRIGYLPGELAYYEDMSGEAFLDFLGGFYGVGEASRRRRLAEALDLDERVLRKRIREYSLGMKRKIGLIQAMQHGPDLLILDEPTSGLDPLVRRSVYELLEELRREGRTVFLSSHDLAEVERVCDEVAIVRRGRLVAVETVEALRARRLYGVSVVFADEKKAREASLILAAVPGVNIQESEGKAVRLKVRTDPNDVISVLAGFEIDDLQWERARLEDIFLEHYGNGELLPPRKAVAANAGGKGAEAIR